MFTELRRPLRDLRTSLELVMAGDAPLPTMQTTDELLHVLHLDGSEKDGKSLTQRLMGQSLCDRVCLISGKDLNILARTQILIKHLLCRLNEEKGNEQELSMAKSLLTVAERQIEREGDICPLAANLYLAAGTIRPDLVNEDIYGQLATNMVGQMLEPLIHGLLGNSGSIQEVEIYIVRSGSPKT